MRQTATSIRVLVALSVLLVVVGAQPGRAATAPPPVQGGLGAFECYRLSQVNTSVSGERLWSLRRDGFGAVYAAVGEWLQAADQPDSRSQRRRLRRLTGDLRRFLARASSQGLVAAGQGPAVLVAWGAVTPPRTSR
jgi:hypothetical protein